MGKKNKYPKAIYNWPQDERPRERPLKFGADKLLALIYNHPNGEPQSSQDEIEITNYRDSTFKLIGIRVLDHIIIGDNNYFSFYNEGLIKV